MNLRLALTCVISFWVTSLRADIGFPLFSTGVDNAGVPLALGTLDPHWTLTGPGIPSPLAATVTTTQSPLGLYAQDPNSRWISVADEMELLSVPYTFQLTFDLIGFDPNTTQITGTWAVDNNGGIKLNGTDAHIGTGTLSLAFSALENFAQFHSFTLNNGFVSGLNTLEFEVENTSAWIALNVNSLNGTTLAIPEPASELFLCIAMFSWIRFRRRSDSALSGVSTQLSSRLGPDSGEGSLKLQATGLERILATGGHHVNVPRPSSTRTRDRARVVALTQSTNLNRVQGGTTFRGKLEVSHP